MVHFGHDHMSSPVQVGLLTPQHRRVSGALVQSDVTYSAEMES